MIHKHKYELDSFTLCINGLIAPFGHCINIYKCKECKKLKIGEVRKLTEEECLFMADRYKEKIENDRDIIRQEIVKDFEDLNKAFEKSVDNNLQLEDRIALLEKALELACERVKYFEEMQDREMGHFEFFGYDNEYDLQAIIEQYKEQAKEMMKSE